MMRALALVVVAGCAADAAPAPTAKLLADLPAWAIAGVGGKLVVVDDGLLSVTALDGATGTKAWTTTLQKQPARGAHGVLVTGGSAIAWFADKAHVLDPATGKLVKTYDTVLHGGGCWLDVKEGACARRCDCSFQIADCATGALRGKRYDGVYMEEVDPDGGMSAGCWGSGGWLHGKAGNLVLISAEDAAADKSKSLAKHVAAAVDLTTGKEVWRREMSASIQSYESGHSADGKTCWFTHFDTALAVLDCATGKQLWTTRGVKGTQRHLVIHVPGVGLYEQKIDAGTMYAERTGKVLWTLALPPRGIGWPKGATPAMGPISLTDVSTVVVLDPASAKPVKSVTVPKDATVVPDASGGFFLASAGELVAFDAVGTELARAAVPAINMELGESLIAMGRNGDVVVVDKATLKELLRVPGKDLSFDVEGGLGKGRVAIWQYDAKTVGRVRLYALTP